jgi:hydroxyacylglutathione hydrolase
MPADLEPGVLPAAWSRHDGSFSREDFVRHSYNEDFVILRQAGHTHFEKPFLYLLAGDDRAMLVDTGAPGVDVAGEVRRELARRAAPLDLVVAHTHGHDDHVAGDAQFRGLASSAVVGTRVDDVCAFFGIRNWPEGIGSIDLGHRLVEVIPVPGHEPASVAFYDRRAGVLLSGDVLYPGRLYVRDAAAYRASVARLVAFTRNRPVAHILGAHIENARTPFVDYPEGTTEQPDEHALELGRAHLLELADALARMGDPLARTRLRDFTIWPVPAGTP